MKKLLDQHRLSFGNLACGILPLSRANVIFDILLSYMLYTSNGYLQVGT
jgi:hypothetical protein